MNDIRLIYKEKNYLINSNVLKGIKSLNLSTDELLLLIYFINEEKALDLNKVKNALNFSEEDILNTYSSLITKGLIEVKVIKENGKVSESISLDILYDKLIMNSKEEKEINTDIYSKFESDFGRILSPIEYETINRWLNLGIDEGMILNALREAVINGVSNLRYIDKILYEWTKKGEKPKEEYKELFDYDWLHDSDE